MRLATRAPVRAYLGRPLPESPNTIKKLMMQEADKVRTEIRKTLKEYQLAGGKFTVAYDEASAFHAPNHYLSISLRAEPEKPLELDSGTDIPLPRTCQREWGSHCRDNSTQNYGANPSTRTFRVLSTRSGSSNFRPSIVTQR